jgi:hypothetical protein
MRPAILGNRAVGTPRGAPAYGALQAILHAGVRRSP